MLKKILLLSLCLWFPFVMIGAESQPEKKPTPPQSDEEREGSMIVEQVEVVGKVPLNKAIQSITVYSEKEMENFNTDGLKSLLSQCPGFLILNGGHYGQVTYSFARGASVNQTLFLIDGIKITDPSTSIGLNTTFISPHLVEKVEIVRGPLSNIYGSNAMGGVVNLKTREKEGVEASASAGSHGTVEGNLYLSKRKDQFTFTLNGNWQKYSDGMDNDEFLNRGINLKGNFQNEKIETGLVFFGNFSDSGIPFNLGVSTPNRQYSQDNYLLAFPLNFQFSGSTTLDFKLSHNQNHYEFSDPDDTWTPFFSNRSTVNEGQATFRTIFLKNLNFSIGIDYAGQAISNQDQSGILLEKKETHFLSAFISSGLDMKKLLLSASFRYDQYKDLNPEFSPQLGFSYLISETLKIRGSYSESFRAPTIPELLNPLWGNPELEPEKGRSLEFGLDIYVRRAILNLVYFNSTYKNLIGFSPVTWKFANLNQADISGIEASASITLFKEVLIWAAYTYLDTHDLQNDQELLRRPRHSLSAMISYKNRHFIVSGEMVYVGKRLDYDELLWATSESPSFNTFNFSLTIPLNRKLNVVGKATNAFNQEYQEILGYPAPGSRFILGIKYKIL